MDYIFRGGESELHKLAKILDDACKVHSLSLGTIRSTMVLIQVLDEAQKAEILVPTTPAPGAKK